MSSDVLARPHFVIIGAMKCATSTLHDQLAAQPWTWMSDPKEPNFFSDEENWGRGLGWYESLFAGAPEGAVCGESSTHYTKLPTYPECLDRLHAALPHAKLVYVMRDPVQRLVSHYIHAWSVHDIDDGAPLDRAVREHSALLDYSRYHMQVEPYLRRYGADRVLPVFQERIRMDPQGELERVWAHVGTGQDVHWDHDLRASNVSSARQRRPELLSRVLEIRALQVIRRSLMPASLRDRIKSRWSMKERPVLSPESLAYVHEALDPDLARLGDLMGLDLSCQTFRENVTGDVAPGWRKQP